MLKHIINLASGWVADTDETGDVRLYDEDGELVLTWYARDIDELQVGNMCRAWKQGYARGQLRGRIDQQFEIKKALGI